MRHPGTEHLVRLLNPNPKLPPGPMADLAKLTATFRDDVLALLPSDGPELSTGLRKLIEAKDCFVRQAGLESGVI